MATDTNAPDKIITVDAIDYHVFYNVDGSAVTITDTDGLVIGTAVYDYSSEQLFISLEGEDIGDVPRDLYWSGDREQLALWMGAMLSTGDY